MAKKDENAGTVKVRVLTAGGYGGKVAKCDDVIELGEIEAKEYAAQGAVDPSPAAVAYAESLKSAPAESPKA